MSDEGIICALLIIVVTNTFTMFATMSVSDRYVTEYKSAQAACEAANSSVRSFDTWEATCENGAVIGHRKYKGE